MFKSRCPSAPALHSSSLPFFRAGTVLASVLAHSEPLSLCPECPGSSSCSPRGGPGSSPPSTSSLAGLFSAAGAAALNLQGAGEPSQRQEGSWDHPAGLLHCGEVAGNRSQPEPPELPTCSRAEPSCAAGALQVLSHPVWCIRRP